MADEKQDNSQAQTPKIEFLIGTPSRSTINARFDDKIQEWVMGNAVGRTKAVSNRVDWNRNIIWNTAKKYDLSLIMIDTDVYPIIPYAQIKQYIYEDFAEGYDVVFAPLLSHGGNLLFKTAKTEDYKKDTPYDAFYSGFGFTAFSKRLVRSLQPLTHFDIINESLDMLDLSENAKKNIIDNIKENVKEFQPIVYNSLGLALPIYFTYSAQLSEDSQFCRRMRGLGVKMAIDPRIKCQHMTEVPFIFDVKQVRASIEAQEKKKDEILKQEIAKRKKELEKDA